ncbi:unnamed protein product [Cyberlindnera jadinii]|uniref:Uncharacterized protein n=1 Tax=Cyberlindnera jadinii (strain ATCC 18201 / CBS 1600 / BCRC 20928 / JCM 3617 / NBRC 0987 / NRRL Y-1542) TaxID=983966 RepID=A0A0H5BZG5_CYBJN|nr:unnamed protein product [Cyberlindnera jadinii]
MNSLLTTLKKMDGRYFAGQKLSATRYNGEHFNKSHDNNSSTQLATDSHEPDDNERLQHFIATS